MKTITIVLDGQNFEVPKFDIGQLERVSDIFETEPPRKVSGLILAIALEDAKPPIEPDAAKKLKCGIDELRDAVDQVLTFNGFKKVAGAASPNAAAPEQPGQSAS